LQVETTLNVEVLLVQHVPTKISVS